MTDQLDILVAARMMVAEHGKSAVERASNCVALLVRVGDDHGVDRWREIVAAIANLRAACEE